MSVIIPKPAFYTGWNLWADRLVEYLKRREDQLQSGGVQLPSYSATGLPSAASGGILIWIADEAKIGVSTITGWKRLRFVT